MHVGFSFSYPPISVLLRQPLSIKKSYAGAIHDGYHLKSSIFIIEFSTWMSKSLFDTCVVWSCVTRCRCGTTSSTLFTVDSPLILQINNFRLKHFHCLTQGNCGAVVKQWIVNRKTKVPAPVASVFYL